MKMTKKEIYLEIVKSINTIRDEKGIVPNVLLHLRFVLENELLNEFTVDELKNIYYMK
jgi:hypothetical protein